MGKEQQIIHAINGLGDDYCMSQKEIAEKLFLNKNTIGVIEKRAMDKFKNELSKRGIAFNDLVEA